MLILNEPEVYGLDPPFKLFAWHKGGFMPDGSLWHFTITYHGPKAVYIAHS
jgi:hypothetical protein